MESFQWIRCRRSVNGMPFNILDLPIRFVERRPEHFLAGVVTGGRVHPAGMRHVPLGSTDERGIRSENFPLPSCAPGHSQLLFEQAIETGPVAKRTGSDKIDKRNPPVIIFPAHIDDSLYGNDHRALELLSSGQEAVEIFRAVDMDDVGVEFVHNPPIALNQNARQIAVIDPPPRHGYREKGFIADSFPGPWMPGSVCRDSQLDFPGRRQGIGQRRHPAADIRGLPPQCRRMFGQDMVCQPKNFHVFPFQNKETLYINFNGLLAKINFNSIFDNIYYIHDYTEADIIL